MQTRHKRGHKTDPCDTPKKTAKTKSEDAIRVLPRKPGQHPTPPKRAPPFEKKGTKNFTSPHSIPLPSALHENKALHNFNNSPTGGHQRSRLVSV